MRKIIILSFITLDGVMQAPGGTEEDTRGGFPFGGWAFSYWDDFLAKIMGEQMEQPFDLLLGRKTYDIFAANWPTIDPESIINTTKKYVVTHNPVVPETSIWKNSIPITDNVVDTISKIKNEDGPDIQVHGSGELIQTLLKHNLVDEMWLKIYPLTLGVGKRLFESGTVASGFTLLRCSASPRGVIVANYQRAGDVVTGSFV